MVRNGIAMQSDTKAENNYGKTNNVNNANTSQIHSVKRKHNEDESLMGRIQAQLKIFIFVAFFVMTAAYLLS